MGCRPADLHYQGQPRDPQVGLDRQKAILKKYWGLFGGSADLNESTYTDMEGDKEFEKGNYAGRNLKFGVREHGMCGALNGIAHSGAFIPYGSSFFCFTDYARGSIRLACLMKLHVIWVFTHDSIGLGEDADPSADRASDRDSRDSQHHPHTSR